ncbi:MAG TPA: hypothetical protein VF421_10215 [Niabella sp.]
MAIHLTTHIIQQETVLPVILYTYMEAQQYNTCLNKKVSIDAFLGKSKTAIP